MFFYSLLLVSQLLFSADTYQLTNYLNHDTKDFELLVEKMAQESWANPEAFLLNWKNDRPDYFNQYVAAYRSRSLQQATPSHPRIIMFSQNADLVVSFNGHRRQRGFDNIELMRFNHIDNRFEFYEMSFVNSKAEISEPNPQKCLECHQSGTRTNVDPRPNWEPYNSWFGFYGSLDDSTKLFKTGFVKKHKLDQPELKFLIDEFDQEELWFENFWNNIKPTDSRYQYLDTIVNDNYNEATINGDLTNRLATLNLRRVARLMKENQEVYEQVKYSIWEFTQCGQRVSISDEVLLWLRENTPLKENYEVTGAGVVYHCQSHYEGTGQCQYSTPTPKVRPVTRLSEAINLLFENFGVVTEDWSMDFKTGGRFSAFERFGLTNDPRPPMRKAIRDEFSLDPDFNEMTCEKAKQESLKKFSDLEAIQNLRDEILQRQALLHQTRARTPLINRCISCHVEKGYGDIPYIPFNDPAKLKDLLSRTGFKRGSLKDEILYRIGPHAGLDEQMPPRGLPSEDQRNELSLYINNLTNEALD